MINGIDHLVILVDDLDDGIAQYRDLGFTVTPGGKHPRFTHNALVTLGDGSYLELISFYEHENVTHRWWTYRDSGGGLIDHALGVDDLAAEIAGADIRGVRYSGPNDGARSRPDGVELVWKTAHADTERPMGLPFLIEDVTERTLRVPAGDAAQHANGVFGIHTLIIAVADIDASATQYGQLLNQTGLEAAGSDQSVAAVGFDVHGQRIELQQPRPGSPMAEQVAARGDGPYQVIFRGPDATEIDPSRAGGARIQIVAE
jgi:catechol 2,3-dioxygenase-like lactoylglutathione lyase family enzyme